MIKTLNGHALVDQEARDAAARNATAIDLLTEDAETIRNGKRTLRSSDFVQGYYQVGTGIVASDYNIASGFVEVAVGDKLVMDPNGFKLTARILNGNDPVTATTLKGFSNLTEYTEYVSEYDGYLVVQVVDPAGQKITPSGYPCTVTVGTSKVEKLEEQTEALSKAVETLPTLAASPKHKPFTRIINDCQDAGKWTVTVNSADIVAVDTTGYILGSQSLRSDNQMRCTQYTYNMLENDLVLKLRINSIATGAQLYLTVANASASGYAVNYCLMRGHASTPVGEWREITVSHTGYETRGSFDRIDFSAVNWIRLWASGNVDWNLQYVGVRPKALKRGIVSFTFDDGYTSQYTGAKILAERGIACTLYHIKEATDKGSADYLTVPQLQEMVNHFGTDIEVHGDPSYDQWETADLIAHWTDSQSFLRENGLGEGRHMAYPNGMHPANVVQLARRFFDSCRTIQPYVPLESYPPADNYRMRAVSGVGASGVNVAKAQEYIDRAVAAGAWLILVFHRIEDGSTSMYCSEADLAAIADYAIASGAHIMTVAEVFDSAVLN